MTQANVRAIPQTEAADSPTQGGVVLRPPTIADGTQLWQLAKDTKVLDVNSSYSYLLWCRDFSDTSVVAESDGRIVGFVTGFRRQAAPNTLFVWQVAVDESQRGKGVGRAMLDNLLDNLAPQGVSLLETTVSPDNPASIAMFTSLARRRNTSIVKQQLFEADDFPDAHEAEDLYIVGTQSVDEGKRQP
ncbi:diaminobutyrate acetyltransferase [Antrihabitans cavernicola]|uniref:L-2,4-diaminobutyric acid acetyltransferase n=1 Tax=Antrihabitans cavernicola TaxID=2495913 RepID=A0A5A7SAJ7_9NOCA|nr:diaminobutyrate acetyltransferase [Spelaeibacter cavernicola]KAA0022946.1 diaminobutyrate acetyltransferase [Spelaeibacter cavernicola]